MMTSSMQGAVPGWTAVSVFIITGIIAILISAYNNKKKESKRKNGPSIKDIHDAQVSEDMRAVNKMIDDQIAKDLRRSELLKKKTIL